jgi:general secretion pathway protein J
MSRERGFTLVELLLAVTLMALLLALAYGGFRAAGQVSERGQVLLEQTGKLRIVQTFIRRQLNQMLPLEYFPDENEIPVQFIGDAHAIQYVAPMPGYLGNGGPQVQRMEVVNGEDGLVLQFSHALYEGFQPEKMFERDPIVLLDHLPYAQFEFLGQDESGENLLWTTTWDDGSVLPLAVRLDVDMPEGSKVHWPVLMTGIRVDEEAVAHGNDVRDYGNAIRDLIRKSGSGSNEN